MESEEPTTVILKLVCPLAIILLPAVPYVLWSAPNPPGPNHMGWQIPVLILAVCAGAWIFSIIFVLKNWNFIKKLGL